MRVPEVMQADHAKPGAASLCLEAVGELGRVDRPPVRLPENEIVLVLIAGAEGEPLRELPLPVLLHGVHGRGVEFHLPTPAVGLGLAELEAVVQGSDERLNDRELPRLEVEIAPPEPQEFAPPESSARRE